jgi:protein tyrosine phosphatase (PTP) superfamily phosphohydrolase (DUF442 family)
MTDISKITDYLYVSSIIGKEDADKLKALNFNMIISMIGEIAPDGIYTLPPFKILWIRTYDAFFIPISIKKLLIGVEAALPIIKSKGKVLVFCREGRHRSIAMAAAILIGMGHTGEEAMSLLTAARKVADPRMFYIQMRIRAFERFWLKR